MTKNFSRGRGLNAAAHGRETPGFSPGRFTEADEAGQAGPGGPRDRPADPAMAEPDRTDQVPGPLPEAERAGGQAPDQLRPERGAEEGEGAENEGAPEAIGSDHAPARNPTERDRISRAAASMLNPSGTRTRHPPSSSTSIMGASGPGGVGRRTMSRSAWRPACSGSEPVGRGSASS